MASKTINFNTPVDLKDVPGLIMAIGEQRTVLLRGEPGIGKSTVLKNLSKDYATSTTTSMQTARCWTCLTW